MVKSLSLSPPQTQCPKLNDKNSIPSGVLSLRYLPLQSSHLSKHLKFILTGIFSTKLTHSGGHCGELDDDLQKEMFIS